MNKGLIMELKKDYAIVLNDNGAMDKIVVKPGMSVGQKIFYFEEDMVKVSSHSNFKYNTFIKSFGSIAALFIVAFTLFYNLNFSQSYAMLISLDINPSIEIQVDKNQNILGVEGKNDDGRSIDFTDLKGSNINDGIKIIKEILVQKGYLDTNRDVLVATYVKDTNKNDYQDSVIETVRSTFNTENVACIKVENKEDVDEAKEQSISLGRYEASKVVDDEETKKKIIDAPVKEITEQIKDKGNVIYYNAEPEKTSDVTAPKEEPKVPVIAPENSIGSNSNTNNNNTEVSTSNEKPNVSAPSDDKLPTESNDNEVNDNKSQINNGVLELEPEKPVEDKNQDNSNEDNNVVVEPDKNVIENNPTSGKLDEDQKADDNTEQVIEPDKSNVE